MLRAGARSNSIDKGGCMYRCFISGVFAAVLTFFAMACGDDPAQSVEPTTYLGASAAFGEGQARVWEKANADGSLLSVGVTFGEDVLTGLPEYATMVNLDLPQEVGTSPFTIMGLHWNPHGHEPDPIYGLPHFDVHFYVVSEQELAAVTPGPDTTPVAAEYVPPDYVSGVIAVPNMGTHWADTTSGEYTGNTFDKTFIYGFYDGNLYFLEPMMTKVYLESKPNVTLDIKQPASFQLSGKAFPTQYRIAYDADAGEYTVELSGMRLQE